MHWLNRIERMTAMLARLSGGLAVLSVLGLLCVVFGNVIGRYALSLVSIGLQELEWHLFATAFLFGVPYAMHHDSHVRVDILYERWNDRRKAWVNLLGTLLFVWPFCVLLIFYGFDFAAAALGMGEGSGDPGGLPHRWIIKTTIPLSFAFVLLVSLGYLTQALRVLLCGGTYAQRAHSEGAHLS
jgi:TRAP-type mannitol/chloroaromatic compound transport system permease small subunit